MDEVSERTAEKSAACYGKDDGKFAIAKLFLGDLFRFFFLARMNADNNKSITSQIRSSAMRINAEETTESAKA